MTRILPHDHEHHFGTRSVHAGQVPEPLSGAVMTPIYQTSTYVQAGLGRHKGYEYARTQNPTREALERNVASLEGATHGLAFGSGLAALDAVLKLLRSGDHVICGENVYGGSTPISASASPSWTCATPPTSSGPPPPPPGWSTARPPPTR
jgi:cystathionine beta-lyase/cystathionine gamma-synthase